MKKFQRIVTDPNVMGGKPCIRGMRITVGNILNLLASSLSKEEILKEYPYLELEDIDDSLKYSHSIFLPCSKPPRHKNKAICLKNEQTAILPK